MSLMRSTIKDKVNRNRAGITFCAQFDSQKQCISGFLG